MKVDEVVFVELLIRSFKDKIFFHSGVVLIFSLLL